MHGQPFGITMCNMMATPKKPGQRLRMARERAGYTSAIAFSNAHDIPQSTYSLHEAGKRKFSPEVAQSYADKLDCSAAWLLTGEGAPPGFQTVEPSPSRTLAIKELDVRASAGHGSDVERLNGEADVVDMWELPAEFVRAQTTAPAPHLRVIRIYGDSMEPMFHSGDRVLVDTSDRKPSPPGVFVIWDGLGLVVKRLEYLPYSDPPAVRMLSANAAYASYERELDEVRISGRVIGKWLWT